MPEVVIHPEPESAERVQQDIVETFRALDDWPERYGLLMELGRSLPPLAPEERDDAHRLRGCQARSWLVAELGADNRLCFRAASEAAIVSGLLALVLRVYSGRIPQEILGTEPWFFRACGLEEHLSPHRQNGVAQMLDRIRAHAAAVASSSIGPSL